MNLTSTGYERNYSKLFGNHRPEPNCRRSNSNQKPSQSSLTCHHPKSGVTSSSPCLNNYPKQVSKNEERPVYMLEARVSETQMLETVKLETMVVRWRLHSDGLIERVLLDQPVLRLHPHNLHHMRSVTLLPKTFKISLVMTEFNEESSLRRNITWIIQFASRKKAKAWLYSIKMLSKDCCSYSKTETTLSRIVSGNKHSTEVVDADIPLALLQSGDSQYGATIPLPTDVSSGESPIKMENRKKFAPPKPPRTIFVNSPTLRTTISLDGEGLTTNNLGSVEDISQPMSQVSTFQSASSVVQPSVLTPKSRPVSGKFCENKSRVRNQPLLANSFAEATAQLPVELSGDLSRRYIVLRGYMEKHQARHLRALRFRAWYPVMWALYSDGTLEEYAKTKSCHDILNIFSLSEFGIEVPMTKADERMDGPNFAVPADCYLNLIRTVTGRKIRYKAPNKLMQIQWLATLSLQASLGKRHRLATGITTGQRVTDKTGRGELSVPEKFRTPIKLSIMQEKCMVDIFGLIVPLWINVIWEHTEHSIIRRRYADSSRHVVKQVTVLENLAFCKGYILSIPQSKKTKRRKISPFYHGDGQWGIPQKSKRRFIVSQSDGQDDIYVRAESSQLRDEWYYILLNMCNTSIKSDCSMEATPTLTPRGLSQFPSSTIIQPLELSWEESKQSFRPFPIRETKSELDYSSTARSPESFSMPTADRPATNEDDFSAWDLVCCSFTQGDRLFYPSIVIERPRYSSIKDHHLGDVAKRKRAVMDYQQESFEILPRLTEDIV